MQFFCLLTLLLIVVLEPPVALCAARAATQPHNANLDTALAYEHLHHWRDAETQYLLALKDPSPAIYTQALAGIERVRKAADSDTTDPDLAAAQYYESESLWSKAEDRYISALSSDSPAVRTVAQRGLERVSKHLRFQNWFNRAVEKLGYLAAAAGCVAFVLLLSFLDRSRKSVELVPFAGTSDYAAKQIAFWLGYVRAKLKSSSQPASLPAGGIRDPAALFFAMPEFRDEVPDAVRDIEIGGVKIRLADLFAMIARPRVRVMGGLNAASPGSTAFADIARRRKWGLSYLQHALVVHRIENTSETTREADLELFAYDVLIKVIKAHAA